MTAPDEAAADAYAVLDSVAEVTPDPVEPVEWQGTDLDLTGAPVSTAPGWRR